MFQKIKMCVLLFVSVKDSGLYGCERVEKRDERYDRNFATKKTNQEKERVRDPHVLGVRRPFGDRDGLELLLI